MTAASIKSGTGVTRFTGSIVASVGSTSALDNNLTPRTSSTVSAGTAANSATNGTGVQYREACCKFFTNTTGAVYGTRLQLSSARDTTGALVFAHVSSSANNPFLAGLTTIRGLGLFLNSSSLGTEEASWMMKGTGDLFDDYSLILVDPSRSTNARQYDNGTGGRGTFDPTDVTDVGVCYQHTAAGPSIRISSIGMVKPTVVIGGTTTPGSFDVVKTHFYTNVTLLHQEPVPNTHVCYFKWTIGDGSTATDVRISNKSFVYGSRVDFVTPAQGMHINDNTFGHTVNAGPSDYIRQTTCSHSSATPIAYVITGNSACDFLYDGVTVSNAGQFQIDDGFPHTTFSASDCVPLTCNRPTIGGTLANALDAAMESAADNALANALPIAFLNNPVGLRITNSGDCALDVTTHTFSGNTYDVEYTGTGTLTITSSTSLTTNATGGGTITLVVPSGSVSAPNLTAGWLEFYNVTQATLIESVATTTGYSKSSNGSDFIAGDTIRLRWRGKGKLPIQMVGVATSGTVTFLDTPETDPSYTAFSVDGATVTEFSFDAGNVQFDIDDPDYVFYGARLYNWYSYAMVSAVGISTFWGAASSPDPSLILIDSDVVDTYLDNVNPENIRQGDTIVIRRTDGVFPVPLLTSGGGGISLYWAGVGYTVETGVSGLTGEESTRLFATAQTSDLADLPTNAELATALDPLATTAEIATAVSGLATASQVSALNNLSSAQVQTAAAAALTAYDPPTKAELDASIASIPAAPSTSAITTALKADMASNPNDYTANIVAVNSVAVSGAGTEADPFGPA